MQSDATWSIILLLLAVVIVAIEFVVPSGGLLAICAISAVIASVVLAFKAGTVWGVSMLTASFIAIPATILGMLKVLPHTKMGRRMVGQPAALEDPQATAMAKWVGRVGIAISDLMPAGMIEVDGQRMEAMAPGVLITKGQRIEVNRVSGSTLYVVITGRLITETKSTTPSELLDQPLSELGLDDLDTLSDTERHVR